MREACHEKLFNFQSFLFIMLTSSVQQILLWQLLITLEDDLRMILPGAQLTQLVGMGKIAALKHHLSLSCCRWDGTEWACPFWQIFPEVQLWMAPARSGGGWCLIQEGALKTDGSCDACKMAISKDLLQGAEALWNSSLYSVFVSLLEREKNLHLRNLHSSMLSTHEGGAKEAALEVALCCVSWCHWLLCSLCFSAKTRRNVEKEESCWPGQFSNDCLKKQE